jgi:hypothetical protein
MNQGELLARMQNTNPIQESPHQDPYPSKAHLMDPLASCISYASDARKPSRKTQYNNPSQRPKMCRRILQIVFGVRELDASMTSSRWLHSATNRSKNNLPPSPPLSISACMVPLLLKVLRRIAVVEPKGRTGTEANLEGCEVAGRARLCPCCTGRIKGCRRPCLRHWRKGCCGDGSGAASARDH